MWIFEDPLILKVADGSRRATLQVIPMALPGRSTLTPEAEAFVPGGNHISSLNCRTSSSRFCTSSALCWADRPRSKQNCSKQCKQTSWSLPRLRLGMRESCWSSSQLWSWAGHLNARCDSLEGCRLQAEAQKCGEDAHGLVDL